VKQQPGNLPEGANEHSLLTVREFCIWKRRSTRWFSAHRYSIPGVVGSTIKDCQIHVGTFLAGSVITGT